MSDELDRLDEAVGATDWRDRLGRELVEGDDDMVEKLVKMRHDKGMTQKEVADLMFRDHSAVSHFERLGADPHLSTLRRYARAVGARITHAVNDAEAPETFSLSVMDLVSTHEARRPLAGTASAVALAGYTRLTKMETVDVKGLRIANAPRQDPPVVAANARS